MTVGKIHRLVWVFAWRLSNAIPCCLFILHIFIIVTIQSFGCSIVLNVDSM